MLQKVTKLCEMQKAWTWNSCFIVFGWRRRKWHEAGERCIIRSFIICKRICWLLVLHLHVCICRKLVWELIMVYTKRMKFAFWKCVFVICRYHVIADDKYSLTWEDHCWDICWEWKWWKEEVNILIMVQRNLLYMLESSATLSS